MSKGHCQGKSHGQLDAGADGSAGGPCYIR